MTEDEYFESVYAIRPRRLYNPRIGLYGRLKAGQPLYIDYNAGVAASVPPIRLPRGPVKWTLLGSKPRMD